MFCAAHLNRNVSQPANHIRGTKYACEADQVESSTYETKHFTDGCQCEF
jgi:hypothetical protein